MSGTAIRNAPGGSSTAGPVLSPVTPVSPVVPVIPVVPDASVVIALTAYDHVGVRVSDKARAIRFYAMFGFKVLAESPQSKSKAVEIENDFGVRIHLVCNGNEQTDARNILQDNDWGFPGITHAAFIVPNLEEVAIKLARAGVQITEGPKSDQRRMYLFCRDPDGNVLELNEMK